MYYSIGCLPKHFTELHTTLAMLKFEPDIIGLSETTITTKVNAYYNPHLKGYTFYQSISNTSRGSVGVFIKKSLDITIRMDLDISMPGIFETFWFDVKHKFRGKDSTIGIVYRHSCDTDKTFFVRSLQLSLTKLNVKKINT